MRTSIVWKLLAINAFSITVVLLIVYLAVQYLAEDYLMALMNTYDITPTDTHEMFLDAVYTALAWAAAVSFSASLVLSLLLTRRVLKPLSQMVQNTNRIAAGEYDARIDVGTHDEIGQLGQSFNDMAESLKEIQALRKRMVIDVAHELRTPLTNIQGYLEALSDGVLKPTPTLLKSLHDETTGLARLVESLLDLARAEAAGGTLARRRVDMSALVHEVLNTYADSFAARGITVTVDECAPPAMVDADPDKMQHVLRNLIDNAWQYTPERGKVRIRSHHTGAGYTLEVANTGMSVDRADLPYLFERFYRADKARSRSAGGAGIGLAIVKELVAVHGGKVGARSNRQETVVWFSLPA